MQFRQILPRRKMVRAFQARPIPGATMERILSSVLHAPSAGYTQGNELLVLDHPQTVRRLFELTDDPADPLPAELWELLPPAVVLPMANKSAYLARYSEPDKDAFGLGDEERWPVPYWDVDAGMASMLILLAAVDQGLGAWFFGLATGQAEVLEAFGVAEGFRPVGAIALGFPAPTDPLSERSSARTRARRPLDEIVHRNRW